MSATQRVFFDEVGREKRSWSIDVPDNVAITGDWMLRQIRKAKALMSRDIGVDGTYESGVIWAGMRPVGRYRIEAIPVAQPATPPSAESPES